MQNTKANCPTHVIKDMILLYSLFTGRREINVDEIQRDASFTYVDLDEIEDVLREFNAKEWIYQKRINSNVIIIKSN